MTNLHTRQNRITAIMLSLVAIGIIAWIIPDQTGVRKLIFGICVTTLWFGLIIYWCIQVRHRVIQPGIRKYLTAMCGFMMLLFMFRGLKYYIFLPETTAARYCWYAYYIPMMFYPACAVCAIAYIGKRDDWKQPRYAYAIFLLPIIISIIVLTNDLHQKTFIFPEDARVWSDVDYAYGLFYAFSFTFFLTCTIACLVMMIKRCRIPQTHPMKASLPLVPPVVGLCYSIAYISGYASFFSDMIITMCFCTIATFEIAIRCGYIRVNSNYPEIFRQSSVAAQIFDENLKLRFTSRRSVPYENEILQNTLKHGEYRIGNTRYISKTISGGYVIWKEDVTELLRLQKELESANEYLEDRNMVQRKNYDSKIKRRKLEEQNRLYNEMQNQTKEKLNKMEALLKDFETASTEEEQGELLQIGILTVYLKRRNNLIFLAKDSRKIPASELRNCMKETAKMLEVFGITCILQMEKKEAMTFGQIVELYDIFERVIEATASIHPVYFVTVAKDNQGYILRIRISGIEEVPQSLHDSCKIISQEEDEYILEMKSVGEEESYEKA